MAARVLLLLLPAAMASGLVADLAAHHHCACVYLLHSGPGMGATTVPTLRQLASRGVYSVTLDVRTVHATLGAIRCTTSYPLYVALSSDQETRSGLLKVSQAGNMAAYIWLLFLTAGSVETFFRNLHIPFDCRFIVALPPGAAGDVELLEVYRVTPRSPLQRRHYGRWRRGALGAPLWPPVCLWRRRSDLQGSVLRFGIVNGSSIWSRNRTHAHGIHGEMWESLSKEANFSIDYVTPADGAYGAERSGSWSGLVGMLQRGEIDLSATILSMDTDRAAVVTFSSPLYSSWYQLFIQKPNQHIMKWNHFLLPFKTTFWYSTATCIIVTASCLGRIFHLEKCFSPDRPVSERDEMFHPVEALFFVFGAFCMQGQLPAPRSDARRIVLLTAHLTAVVLLAAYSASLISFLAVQTTTLPFTNLKGLLDDGTYTMGTRAQSSEYEYFAKSTAPLTRTVFRRLMAPNVANFPSTLLDGYQRVCSTKYAFLAPIERVTIFAESLNCSLAALPNYRLPNMMAIAFAKNSSLADFFNYHFQKLHNGGILRRERMVNWADAAPYRTLRSVDLTDVAPLLVLLLAVAATALATMLLECRWRSN